MHLLVVGWITLRPVDVPWVSPTNLHPFHGIRADLELGLWQATLHIGGSVLLLAPLGVLLPLAGGRLWVTPLGSLVCTVVPAALLSLGIELVQTTVPGQVVDVDALLLNTLGVALTHVAVVPAGRARLRRRVLRTQVAEAADPEDPRPDFLAEPLAGARMRCCARAGAERSRGGTRTIPRVHIAP